MDKKRTGPQDLLQMQLKIQEHVKEAGRYRQRRNYWKTLM